MSSSKAENPLFLAPMAELSHRALRELIEGFGGCDEYFSEMISAPALLAGGPFEKWYIDGGPKPEKLVYQLVSACPARLAKAAAVLDRLECAGIDINMGCSAPLIRKSGAGVAWMADIDRAGEMIRGVRAQVKRRLSVKLRIGLNDDFEYLVRFCKRLESEGTELITLHPRTASEKFKRRARWDYVAALKKELKIAVAGNGDITSLEDIERRYHDCDAIMIGRAAVRQPWIFAQAKKEDFTTNHAEPQVRNHTNIRESEEFTTNHIEPKARNHTNIRETGLRFLELLARHQPPEFHLSRARRFFGFFCDNLKWGTFLKNLINREESLSGIEKAWSGFFSMGSDPNYFT